MRVRAAVPEDITRLLAIERQAGTAAHWSEQHYQAIFVQPGADHGSPGRLCLVAESAAGSRGKADCTRGAGEDRPLQVMGFLVAQCAGEDWEIENLVVDAGCRRRGLASRLLEQLLRCAGEQGAKAVTLEVRQSNQAARALYAGWGFREAGQRRNYYRDPEEAAIVLTFSPPASLVKNG